mmetsp:Transcript_3378/g.5036  ORF Transcript_3378/g.5036 Transcript_3378/m.5036 type:complete len:275 (-) Transcript_3378:168-992(-)
MQEISRVIVALIYWCFLGNKSSYAVAFVLHSNKKSWKLATAKVGDLLSDLPTPSLLLELSLADSAASCSLDEFLQNQSSYDALDGALFVHTTITDTSVRDAITKEEGSGKSLVIGEIDVCPNDIIVPCYLGIGLANHHAGGYYWARGMGMGASLPAPGICVRPASVDNDRGELYWKKREPGQNAKETTEESSNSNDGKRSEWADFVVCGDTVQLVPTSSILSSCTLFAQLLGVRRIGRPLGADPIVETIWVRKQNDIGDVLWVPQEKITKCQKI